MGTAIQLPFASVSNINEFQQLVGNREVEGDKE
jgi:hypothetical protein